MKSAKFGGSVSACETKNKTTDGCLNLCGMCPCCVFAPKPPGCVQSSWSVSDKFRRTFVLKLILHCRDNTRVLQNIQSALAVTSWTLLIYARSRSPTSPRDYPNPSTGRALCGRPPVGLDRKAIWDWFNGSSDWIKSHYLLRLFSLCDSELLRTVANLTSVLMIRHKRGFLQFNVSSRKHDEDSDEDSEDPALMIVPGSSKSVSGVSRYRDFICCLPVNLSKRILGLLDEHTLRYCQRVCRRWQQLVQETLEDMKFRRIFQEQIKATMKRYRGLRRVSPTYANFVEVPVPIKDDEEGDIYPTTVLKVQPFEAAYAKVKTKTVQLEERNVYCGAFYVTMVLDKEDPHRVVDYRGGSLMAAGSRDRAVHLFYVGSETKGLTVMKGHVGSIRSVLLCEDRDLVITASSDATIRCWNLNTDECVMVLYGHTRAVNCLDVHADRLVSGAKDHLVKDKPKSATTLPVWSLHTGKHLEEFNFRHPSSVQCVRINSTAAYSSCDHGLVKVWDLKSASLLRVIHAHTSSVRCLFLDKWHLLSGDCNGRVMSWSVHCDAKQCLMAFNHPQEIKSLTLVYLRVITGCADGKIRVFNFLTGDCLREIQAEDEAVHILSLHFHDNSILVNTKSSVKHFQFAKVFWDYTTEEDSAASLRRPPFTFTRGDHTVKVASASRKMVDCSIKPRRDEEFKPSVMLSEKAVSERMKRRGPHHPLTCDCILLRVNAINKAQCTDEASVNMQRNAQLRDSWGPQDPLQADLQALQRSTHTHRYPPWEGECHARTRPKTCVPVLKRTARQSMMNRAQSHCNDTHRDRIRTASGFPTSVTDGKSRLMRSPPNIEASIKTSTTLCRSSPVGPSGAKTEFRLLTVTQLEDCVRARSKQSCQQRGDY